MGFCAASISLGVGRNLPLLQIFRHEVDDQLSVGPDSMQRPIRRQLNLRVCPPLRAAQSQHPGVARIHGIFPQPLVVLDILRLVEAGGRRIDFAQDVEFQPHASPRALTQVRRRTPSQRFLRKARHIVGHDAAGAESGDEQGAVAPGVVRHQVAVRRDDGPQKLAEADIHRRAVVQCAYAHIEHMCSRFGRLPRQPLSEVGAEINHRAQGTADPRQPHQIARAPDVYGKVGVEHGGHQDGAAQMRFEGIRESGGRRRRTRALRNALRMPMASPNCCAKFTRGLFS